MVIMPVKVSLKSYFVCTAFHNTFSSVQITIPAIVANMPNQSLLFNTQAH